MKIFSFDNNSTNNKIKRDPIQGELFNLFQKNIVLYPNIPLGIYIVPREYEMRLDRISNHIYGSPDYMEELMVLNDILNPYSVKEGQYIFYCNFESLGLLYTNDNMSDEIEKNRQSLIKSSQPNRDRQKLSNSDKNLPPTIKPSNLNQIKVNKDNSVQIINTFE